MGQPKNQDGKERITVFIPAELNTKLRVEAAKTRKTISQIVQETLEARFEGDEEEQPSNEQKLKVLKRGVA